MITLAFANSNPRVLYENEDVIYDQSGLFENAELSSIKITYEINQPTILEFTAPKGSVYESLIKDQTKNIEPSKYMPIFLKALLLIENEKSIFKGFLTSFEIDFYGNVKAIYMSAFFALKYAITSIGRIKSYFPSNGKMKIGDLFYRIFAESNVAVVGGTNPLLQNGMMFSFRTKIGSSIENDETTIVEKKELDNYGPNVAYVLDLLKGLILDKYGGYILEEPYGGHYDYFNESYICYYSYEDLIRNEGQVLQIGENILDLSKKINTENIYNGVVPTGKDNLALSSNYGLETFNNFSLRKLFINPETSEENNFIYTKYNFKNFDEIEDSTNLEKAANNYLNLINYPYDIEIQVKALDLSLVDSSKQQIKCGELIRIVSPIHNLGDYFLSTKIVKDLLNPSNSDYSFGSSSPRITENNDFFKYDYQNSFFRKSIANINNILNT